jgi:hypothetical protein
MMINGRYVTHSVLTVECREELDADAYWNLDFDGQPLAEGEPLTLLYDKVAWPTVAAAQEQFRLQQDALAERHRHKPRPRPQRGAHPRGQL